MLGSGAGMRNPPDTSHDSEDKMKTRGPKTVVVYIELEDNCGAILQKSKLEIPVEIEGDMSDPKKLDAAFKEFLSKHFPTRFVV